MKRGKLLFFALGALGLHVACLSAVNDVTLGELVVESDGGPDASDAEVVVRDAGDAAVDAGGDAGDSGADAGDAGDAGPDAGVPDAGDGGDGGNPAACAAACPIGCANPNSVCFSDGQKYCSGCVANCYGAFLVNCAG
jgi:hypothetical protein